MSICNAKSRHIGGNFLFIVKLLKPFPSVPFFKASSTELKCDAHGRDMDYGLEYLQDSRIPEPIKPAKVLAISNDLSQKFF